MLANLMLIFTFSSVCSSSSLTAIEPDTSDLQLLQKLYIVDGVLRLTIDKCITVPQYLLLVSNPAIISSKATKVAIRLSEKFQKPIGKLVQKFRSVGLPVKLEHDNNELMPDLTILQDVSSINEVWTDFFDMLELISTQRKLKPSMRLL
jgi:hypothetical protein